MTNPYNALVDMSANFLDRLPWPLDAAALTARALDAVIIVTIAVTAATATTRPSNDSFSSSSASPPPPKPRASSPFPRPPPPPPPPPSTSSPTRDDTDARERTRVHPRASTRARDDDTTVEHVVARGHIIIIAVLSRPLPLVVDDERPLRDDTSLTRVFAVRLVATPRASVVMIPSSVDD